MKRFAAMTLIFLFLLISCGESAYRPMMILPEGFTIDGDVISGKLVNVYFFSPYDEIVCDDGGIMTLYSDETLSTYLENDSEIELFDGDNDFVLVFERGDESATYKLRISCVMILDFKIDVVKDKTYAQGEEFDRSTVVVTAKKENGDFVAVTDYVVSFEPETSGEYKVDISYGGIVHSISVNIE
ncbi:MAG: bacterial Ig-like domain-containing protein [Clostridia bacterium]|nr:bacterial Ig-like domain-containing protein [Clostridia bacterium]